jgi:hypothetical protein
MQKEAAQKLIGADRHQLPLTGGAHSFRTKRQMAIGICVIR